MTKEEKIVYAANYRATHREELAAKKRIYDATHREEKKAYYAIHKRKYLANDRLKRYGITRKQFDDMCSMQCGRCLICNKDMIGKDCQVDHCHETGQIRGLLCQNCNILLGHAKDNPGLLIKAASYLKAEGNI